MYDPHFMCGQNHGNAYGTKDYLKPNERSQPKRTSTVYKDVRKKIINSKF